MTAPSQLSLVEPYFDAWNARVPEAVVAAFADGGTCTDRLSPGRRSPVIPSRNLSLNHR
jgi:hypothetical protein